MADSADSTEKIVDIKVNIEEAIQKIVQYQNRVKDVKNAEDALKKSLKEGRITQEKYDTEMEKAKLTKDEYKKSIRELEKEIKSEITQQKAQQGSLRQLRAELSNATKAYDDMSKAERESAAGKALKDHINQVTSELKGAEEATQRFYRNVGNYENSIVSALGQNNKFATAILQLSQNAGSAAGMFEMAAAHVKAFGVALGSLMLNPVTMGIAALAATVEAFNIGVDTSEENTNKWNQAIAPIRASVQLFTRDCQNFADSVISAFGKMRGVLKEAIGYWLEAQRAMGHAVPSMKSFEKATDNVIKATKLQASVQEQTKKNVIATAEENKKLAEIQIKLMQTEKYSASDRKKFASEYEEIVKKQTDRVVKLRKTEYDMLVAENTNTQNDYETNLKIARAKASITEAETERYNKMRTIERKMNTIAKAEASAQASASASIKTSISSVTAALKEQERFLKERDQRIKEILTIEKSAVQQAEDSLIALIQDSYDKQIAELNVQYERRVAQIKEQLAKESELTITAKQALQETLVNLEKKHTQDVASLQRQRTEEEIRKTAAANAKEQKSTEDAEAAKTQAREGAFQAASELTSGLQQVLEAAGEDNEAAAQLAKIVAIANIAISTGEAIAKMTSAEAGKGILGVVTMASGIATILVNIASAISYVKSAKFADGGDVSGEGSSTSDSIPAMLSDGESVINATSTAAFAPLLSAINQAGGGVPIYGKMAGGTADINSMMRDATEQMFASMPAPVVSVKDITDVSNRVAVKERIAKMK